MRGYMQKEGCGCRGMRHQFQPDEENVEDLKEYKEMLEVELKHLNEKISSFHEKGEQE